MKTDSIWMNVGRRAGRCAAMLAAWVAMSGAASADTRFVSQNSFNPGAPFKTWDTAAHSIQAALDESADDDTVLVTNGTYVLTAEIAVTKGVTLKSVNGRDATIVDGNWPTATNRCVLVNHADAVVDGFTFSNGFVVVSANYGGGAGVRIESNGGLVTNCTMTCNQVINTYYPDLGNNGFTAAGGAGALLRSGTVADSIIAKNTSYNQSGGVLLTSGGTLLSGCEVTGNVATGHYNFAWAGGVLCYSGGGVDDCDVVDNVGPFVGGVMLTSGGQVLNSRIVGNELDGSTDNYRAGGLYVRGDADMNVADTLIAGNVGYGVTMDNYTAAPSGVHTLSRCVVSNQITSGAFYGRGVMMRSVATIANTTVCDNGSVGVLVEIAKPGYGRHLRSCLIHGNSGSGVHVNTSATDLTISGCTISDNQTFSDEGGGLYLLATNQVSVSSSIVSGNRASGGTASDVYDGTGGLNAGDIAHSCLGINPGFTGAGIIEGDPKFVDAATADFRLGPGSPCVNAGLNEAWMVTATDLDGNRRVFADTVDMGCYEKVLLGTVIAVR